MDRVLNNDIQPPAEQQAIRDKCFHPSGTFVEFPIEDVETSIPDRFEKIVSLYPDRLAVTSKDDGLTYLELNRLANRIARAILADGYKGMAVGLFLPYGLWPIAAHLGVLKSGKMSVLADPSQPADRNHRVLEESQAGIVLTNNNHLVRARQLANPAANVINLDDLDPLIGHENLGLAVDANSYAYLHYTSGSTGTSRAAIKRHGNVLHSVMNLTNDYRVCAEDRILLNVRNTLSKHTFEALLNGAALHTYDVREDGLAPLARRMREHEITMSKFFPSTFRSWLATLSPDERFPSMRLIRLGGETVYGSDVERYRRFFTPDCLLINSYGSAETGSVSNYFVDRDTCGSAAVPAGFPIPGKEVSIVDSKGNELPPGDCGEIVVKSNFLSQGYWRRPDLTSEKFRDANGARMKLCHTGDLGRISENGCLHHLGRIDSQIKVRGFRVDLGEIESLLSAHPDLAGAAVIARPNGVDDVRLIAYIVPRSAQSPSVGALRSYLGARLPEYMIPSFYQRVAALPLTDTGKINRRALPEPDHLRPELGTRYVAPRNELERQLVALWEEILDVFPIGVDDDFFELGGYSLLGARLMAELKNSFQIDLPLPLLGEQPTIAQLAVHVARIRSGQADPPKKTQNYNYIVKLQSAEGQTPVICLSHAGNYRGDLLRFAQLNRLIGAPFCFYGIQARGADGASQPHGSVEEMAAAYVEEIHALNPHGPHYLIGECGAAPIAYETARQLQAGRENVALLVLLDARGADHDARGYFWRRYIWYRYFPWLCYPWSAIKEVERNFKRRVDRRLPELPWLKGRQRLEYLFDHWKQVLELIYSYLVPSSVDASDARNGSEHKTQGSGKRSIHSTLLYPLFRMARLRYHYLPYAGKLAVIVNEKWYEADPTLGWPRLARGGLEVHRIPGDHDTYITQNVATVANVLRDCLQRAVGA